ncbi:uncharacterized protein [Lolium perenne]|uniref:uncharacterized protein n=1 Tax=Lolium perenne TaxID=4522 RepID=UPI003A990267
MQGAWPVSGGLSGRSSGSASGVVDGDVFTLPADIGRMPKCGRSTLNSAFSAKDMAFAAEEMSARELGWVFDIGLAGVAKVDMFTHFNRDHSFFLLQCVDSNNGKLVLGHGRSVPVNGSNMSSILGLKEGGSVELEHVDGPPEAEEVYDARLMLGLSLGNTEIDTVALVSIVKEEHPAEPDEYHVNRFKLAYAMLAVSVFFRPGGKRWQVPRDAYLLAAMIPDLGNINWGNYVARGIIDGSFQVQKELANRSRGHSVYGCLYALEVLYFDHVAGGAYAVNPGLLPRVMQYGAASISMLIRQDTLNLATEKVYGMFMRNFSVAPLIQSRGIRIGLGSVAPSVGRMGIGIHGVGDCGSVASGTIPAVAAPTSEHRNVQVLQVSIEDVPKLVRSTEDWLRDAMAAEEVRSKERTSKFYAALSDDIQMNDPHVIDKVDAHEKKEEWLTLFHLKKMLEHLVERGVGQYVPRLLDKLAKINSSVDGTTAGVVSACVRSGLPICDMPGAVMQGDGGLFFHQFIC